MLFKYIKADSFFKDYLPHVKNYKRKISGRSGRGNALSFTKQEEKEIMIALKKMIKEYGKPNSEMI